MPELNTLTPKFDIDDAIEYAVTQLRKSDVAISEMEEQYLPLRVNGVDDREGLKVVTEARKTAKKIRCEVEKTRKELKADANRYGKAVDDEAKRLKGLIEPIEQHLIDQENAVQKELDRIKAEEAAAKERKIEARIERLNENKLRVEPQLIRLMDDEEFEEYFGELQTAAQKEAEEREAERIRLDAEQKKLDAERKELEAERRRLAELAEAEEKKRAAALEAERLELQKKAEAEAKLRAEERAKEQAELDRLRKLEEEREQAEQQRLKQEQEEKAAADAKKAEEARLRREEELRPVREQLNTVAESLEQMRVPASLAEFDGQVSQILCDAAKQIRSLAEEAKA